MSLNCMEPLKIMKIIQLGFDYHFNTQNKMYAILCFTIKYSSQWEFSINSFFLSLIINA